MEVRPAVAPQRPSALKPSSSHTWGQKKKKQVNNNRTLIAFKNNNKKESYLVALRHQLFVKAHSLVIFIVRHFWIVFQCNRNTKPCSQSCVCESASGSCGQKKRKEFLVLFATHKQGDGPGSDGPRPDRDVFLVW